MSDFVEVQLSPIFGNFAKGVTDLQDDLLLAGAQVLRREEESSIKQRWYDTGATLNSLQDEIIINGNTKSYRLFPTAVSPKGAPYPLFGEYGTGRLGALSGRPAPRGYRYGRSPGMAARRYSRIAVAIARPKINALTQRRVTQFAANMTTN